MTQQEAGIVMLADGTCFEGVSVGVSGSIVGEVVFNTAQTGYQEILTDPSYAEQFIVFTQPHIGNVGINQEDWESERIHATGVIMRSLCERSHHFLSEQSLKDFLQAQHVIAISEIDTRALTHHLRQFGSLSACLMSGDINHEKALYLAKQFSGLAGKDLTQQVTTKERYTLNHTQSAKHHIVVYDFGVKKSILNCLVNLNCAVTVVPADTQALEVLALKPDGILLSNGPGDPAACLSVIKTIQTLLSSFIPIMAICLGHQLLALASGASTHKMTFGHHGANHPIQCQKTKIVSISSQNHGFVVSDINLPACLKVTHRSLFDNSIAGIERTDVPAFGFQGHPEAGPGPIELQSLFTQFKSMLEVTHA